MSGAAYHLDRHHLDGLALREQEVPEPGPRDVVIRVHAASLNRRDLFVLGGQYPIPLKRGVIPLADGAGEVIAVGEEVRRAEIGDRVAVTYFRRWVDGHLTLDLATEQYGASHDGMLASYACAREESVVRIPTHLSFVEAATLGCAGVTAWAALHGPRPVAAGDTVLTVGTGPVALFGMQLARDAGARLLSVTSDGTKADRLYELGASAVIDRREHPEWAKQVRKLTDDRGVDHIVEAVGPATLAQSMRSAGFNSNIALIGVFPSGPVTLDHDMFTGNLFTIRRLAVGSRTDFEALSESLEQHGTKPVIDQVFDFADACTAYRHMEENDPFGKVVITMTQPARGTTRTRE
jgi:NADPH:quinone reductase-like Zn-dependent oxidoreductase